MNYDAEAGIHFGFIYQNDVDSQEIHDRIISNGTDLGWESARADMQGVCKSIAELIAEKTDGRKLYACVRHVSLRQLGHFMMGTARIAGQSVTVSGAYGSDGLPMDYEELTPAAREKLLELPPDLTETFWAGGGHNTSGNEAQAMRDWAWATFEFKGR